MARNEQLIRQHKLLQLLEISRFGRTLDELKNDLIQDLGLTKLHERTVRRDVEALQAAGFDIQNEQVERGKVYKLGINNTGRPRDWNLSNRIDRVVDRTRTALSAIRNAVLAGHRNVLEQNPRVGAQRCLRSLQQLSKDAACVRHA